MSIQFKPETEQLIREWMARTGIESPDLLIQLALQSFDGVLDVPYEDLDPDLRRDIEVAEAEYQRGGGIPVDEAFAMFRKKHLGN